MGFRALANMLLAQLPIHRVVPGSDLTYRISSLDNFLVAAEIFEDGEYAVADTFGAVSTFVDLGCNCGFFTLFLAKHAERRGMRGLMIDAHPAMVSASQWHVVRNDLTGVSVIWGLAGGGANERAKFFLNIDAAGSTQFARVPDGNVSRNPFREIEVPVISLLHEWELAFGTERCGVLKIDIEGSELLFLQQERDFLHRTDRVLIEIHKWLVNGEAVHSELSTAGFKRVAILRDTPDVTVALYQSHYLAADPGAPRAAR